MDKQNKINPTSLYYSTRPACKRNDKHHLTHQFNLSSPTLMKPFSLNNILNAGVFMILANIYGIFSVGEKCGRTEQ